MNMIYEDGRFFLEGSEKHEFPEIKRVVYIHREMKRLIVWDGRKKKPVENANYRCPDDYFNDAMEQELKSCRRLVQEIKDFELKCKNEVERLLKESAIGDVFYCSWGWEQTNIDFYQVVAIKGKKFSFRKLKQDCDYNAHHMQGKCVPRPNDFAKDEDEVMVLSLNKYGVFKKSSFESLKPADFEMIDDKKVYESHNYSNYA